MNIIEQIYRKIFHAKKISLFFHQLPDLDALGSSFGLKRIIELNFPDKEIKVIGYKDVIQEQKIDYFLESEIDEYDDEYIKNSLGIILDTANYERIFSKKYNLCQDLIRIDHHPHREVIGSIEWVDEKKSSTCEMVCELIKTIELRTTPEALNYLYFGILTDTNRFMYQYTSESTYLLVAWMLSKGLQRELVHNHLYVKKFNEAQKDVELFSMIKITANGVGHLFLDQTQNKRFNTKTFSNKVYLMSGFKEIKIWTILYYDEINQQWKGSIRSRDYVINDVAANFNGGGHKLAAGFKLEKPEDFALVLKQLEEKITKNEVI